MQKVQVKEPLDMIKISFDEIVIVKLRGGRKLVGNLKAFDQHLSIVLTNVIETYEEKTREFPVLFIRGDLVVLVSPKRN